MEKVEKSPLTPRRSARLRKHEKSPELIGKLNFVDETEEKQEKKIEMEEKIVEIEEKKEKIEEKQKKIEEKEEIQVFTPRRSKRLSKRK